LTLPASVSIEKLVLQKRSEILRIAERHGAYNVRVSVARGEAGPDSDVDLLIDAGEKVSSWFPGGLIVDLEDLLGRRVDVVEEVALRPELRPYVLRDARPL
jgi:predicted nucleotidyltransferase